MINAAMQPSSLELSLLQPAETPLKSMADSRHIVFAGMKPAEQTILERELAKSHVGLCDYAVTISVSSDVNGVFLVERGSIVLHRRIFDRPLIVPLVLRHAIE